VPLTEIAYASNERNDDTISIEVCHPDETGQFSDTTYWRTVELTAWLCRTFRLDPEGDVIRHYDVTGKRCPLYYVEHPEAWEDFLVDVAAAVENLAAEEAS
jgi:N-acetylmuramoyl-L-alanine amidase